MENDIRVPVHLTDRMLVMFILKITGLSLLITPITMGIVTFLSTVDLIQAGSQGIPSGQGLMLQASLGVFFALAIPAVLLVTGEGLSALVCKKQIVLDNAATTLAALAKAVGIIMIAISIGPLCLAYTGLSSIEAYNTTTSGMKVMTSQQMGSLASNIIAVLLGLFMILYANWFINLIPGISKESTSKPTST